MAREGAILIRKVILRIFYHYWHKVGLVKKEAIKEGRFGGNLG